MVDKAQIRKSRDNAISLELELEDGDSIQELISRDNGLFCITRNSIMRVRSPDDIDPDTQHNDVPWEQSRYLPHGASDPFVARTVIQTMRLAETFFDKRSDEFISVLDISWEVMNSLISLRLIKQRLERGITDLVKKIEENINEYVDAPYPKPLPQFDYFDIEFRSFINEVRRVLNKISELFTVLTSENFESGRFDKAQQWAVSKCGEDSLVAQMLTKDCRWIELWIDIRNAIEHPKSDKFVETSNFCLEPNRQVRLPTWRFIHPDYEMARPQNLLDVFEICINNILKFFEELQIALIDGHAPEMIKVSIECIPETQRDQSCPMRFKYHAFVDTQES